MAFFFITAMTLFAIVMYCWLIASSHQTNLYSLRNLFLTVWLYYGFAVGIDILTGAEIPYRAGEVYMMDPSTWGSVAFVMWSYVLCGVSFIATYLVMQGSQEIRPIELKYDLRTPPEWCLLLLHVAALYIYVEVLFGLDRMERIAMSQLFASYKFATLVVPLMLALDILVVLTERGRKAVVAIGLALLLAFVTGNRNYILFVFLVAAFHWRPALRGWKLVGMVSTCAFLVITFKTLYAVAHDWAMGGRVDAKMFYDNLQMTLSGLDAYASYVIAAFYTDQPSPLWLGKSYFQTPILLAWPRFLGGINVSTLAEDYVWRYHTAMAARGGAMAFSAIAEAWLNFGYFGSALLGVFWGAIANFFDRRPRGVMYCIVLLMIARLFRSDAASLFKNWVLVWGAMFVVALTVLTIYTVIVEPKLSRSRRPVLGMHRRRPLSELS